MVIVVSVEAAVMVVVVLVVVVVVNGPRGRPGIFVEGFHEA